MVGKQQNNCSHSRTPGQSFDLVILSPNRRLDPSNILFNATVSAERCINLTFHERTVTHVHILLSCLLLHLTRHSSLYLRSVPYVVIFAAGWRMLTRPQMGFLQNSNTVTCIQTKPVTSTLNGSSKLG